MNDLARYGEVAEPPSDPSGSVVVAEGVDDDPRQQAEQHQRDRDAEPQLRLLRPRSRPIWARVSMMPNRNSTITAPT